MTPFAEPKQVYPETVAFQTEPEIAVQQMRQALAAGVPPGVALADSAYGNDSKFRAGITEPGLPYAVGIMPATGLAARRSAVTAGAQVWLWPARQAVAPRRDASFGLGKALTLELAPGACQTIQWRDGSNTPLTLRCARVREASST